MQNIIGDSLQHQTNEIKRGREAGTHLSQKEFNGNGARTIANALAEQVVKRITYNKKHTNLPYCQPPIIVGYIQNAGQDQRIFDGGHLPTTTKDTEVTETSLAKRPQPYTLTKIQREGGTIRCNIGDSNKSFVPMQLSIHKGNQPLFNLLNIQKPDKNVSKNVATVSTDDEALTDAYAWATYCSECEGLEIPILANLKYGW